jgi:GT2 family glycosyltransferase
MLSTTPEVLRPRVCGKFIQVQGEKFYIRGVTYGTFQPDEKGEQFPPLEVVEADFKAMRAQQINAIRTYTPPPIALLDLAQTQGLMVMVGIPWPQHLTFLDERSKVQDILKEAQTCVQRYQSHPALLCYTIGNEIPANIVRWYGKPRIERFLWRLYRAVKKQDPETLVTYVNYPTTEYLSLPFLDFDCFNVYLETQEKLDAYLMRLHNLCGDRPLVLAEIGLDSLRNGLDQQAETLRWQLASIYAKGCAGAFVFSWTDEWWRGGLPIEDWDFGLVDRARQPKPALEAVAQTFAQLPCPGVPEKALPRISVVVCSYNGSRTIHDTLEGLRKVDYPNFETIVVNDGSKDATPDIVREYPEVILINTENRGLSSARNTGMYRASGEIIAYLDDDAYPDPHWLRYLAYAYAQSNHAGIGGPNIAPAGGGHIADSVAYAPGDPVHVLLNDEIAEHIPGCNMSFRKAALLEVEGFDPIYRAAGDDVDLCWRIQASGKTIGFHPGAFVWHHRRNSLKAYWNQQKGYGKAEALLEKKWPEKYNALGHLTWHGRIYGNGLTVPVPLRKDKIFYGTWGTALFQSLYQPATSLLSAIPLMPEWHLLLCLLAIFSILSMGWAPLFIAFQLLLLGTSISIALAFYSAYQAAVAKRDHSLRFLGLTALLHLIQPFARLYGRIKHGLSPWRRGLKGLKRLTHLFKPVRTLQHWSEEWRAAEDWLRQIEHNGSRYQIRLRRGDVFDEWDLALNTGPFSNARGLLTIEEYGMGKQYVKFRTKIHCSIPFILLIVLLHSLSIWALLDEVWLVALALGLLSCSILLKFLSDTAQSSYLLSQVFLDLKAQNASPTPQPEAAYATSSEQTEEQLESIIAHH